MKKFKKFMAIATATILTITPMTVFGADTATNKTVTGAGAVENDNSTAPTYDAVVLPTMGANTFDFTLDPNGLLHEYDPDVYATQDTLLFRSETAAATLAIKSDDSTTDKKLYKKTYVELSNVNEILSDLEVATSSSPTVTFKSAATNEYYVWTPKSDTTEGQGEYKKLTDSNLYTYIIPAVTESAGTYSLGSTATMVNPKLEASASNGKVYKIAYTEVTDPTEAGAYVTAASGSTVSTISDGLYKTTDSGTTFTPVTVSDSSILVYSPAFSTYNGTSDIIKIENKSTKAKTVTATLKVTNSDGLTFTDDVNFKKDDPENEGQKIADNDSMVYLAVTDGSTSSAVKVGEDGVATITGTYELAAPTSTPLTYMTNQKDSLTGSHIYKQFENNDVTYTSVSLKVTGKANKDADWDAYVKALKDYTPDPDADPADPTDIKPGLEVVYTIEDAITITMTTDGVVTMTGLRADANVTGNDVIYTTGVYDTDRYPITNIAWGSLDNWSEDNGGTISFTLPSDFIAYYKGLNGGAGDTVTVHVTLTSGRVITATQVFTN